MADYREIRTALGEACLGYNSEFNIYDRVPRSLVPPAVIIKPRSHRSVQYPKALNSPFAEWHWSIQLIIGQVDDQTAHDQVGAMISPNSDLILALESASVSRGYVQVMEGAMSEFMVDTALYVNAELSVYVQA